MFLTTSRRTLQTAWRQPALWRGVGSRRPLPIVAPRGSPNSPLVTAVRAYHVELAHDEAAACRDRQARHCEHVTLMGGAVNVVLMVCKGLAGYVGNSTAMMADAAHSLGDLVGDAVSYLAIREARKPPDLHHPFGHGKFESVGAFGIAGLLMVTALETAKGSGTALLAITSAGASPLGPPTALAAAAAVLCIGAKELLYRVTLRAGLSASSPATVANAHHHRTDAYTSVVALVGIGGAQLGWAFCDPLAGTVVSCFIARAGWRIGLDAFADLVDTAVDPGELGLRRCLAEAVAAMPDVVKVDNVRARKSGPFLAVSFHLHVRASMTVAGAHDAQHALRCRVLAAIEGVRDITIAIFPADCQDSDAAEYPD